MPEIFDPNTPIYIQVMELIKKEIVSGKLVPGDRIDSVRDLAIHYGVNPNTIQRSLSELEREGLLKSERTVGRFICDDSQRIDSLREDMSTNCVSKFVEEMGTIGFSQQETIDKLTFYVKEKENGREKGTD